MFDWKFGLLLKLSLNYVNAPPFLGHNPILIGLNLSLDLNLSYFKLIQRITHEETDIYDYYNFG
jgi:hypothetical protein